MSFSSNPLRQNFTPTPPSLKDLLDQFGRNLLTNLNCHHIATIQSFNPLTQTATATINYQKTIFKLNDLTQQYEPVQQAYPILADCPVVIMGGGSTALTMPIASGDECLVLFNDRDLDNWFSGSSTAGVATPRLHSFADGLILVGVHSLLYSLLVYDTTRACLRAGKVPGAMTAIGVNPSNSKVLVTNTYPANTVTLNTLLQQLCADLQNLVTALTTNAATFIAVTGAPGSPSPLNPSIVTSLATVSTSLSAVATALGGLLE